MYEFLCFFLDLAQHQEFLLNYWKSQYQYWDIFGPSPNFLECFGGNTYGTRLYDFPSEVSRFCDKFQKMYFETNPGDRGDKVSGYDSKLKNNDFVFIFRKSKKNKENKVTLNLLAKEENAWRINRIE